MAPAIAQVLGVLSERGIEPSEEKMAQLPNVGQFGEQETTYATSLEEVFRNEDGDGVTLQEGRFDEWWREIENIITQHQESGWRDYRPIREKSPKPHWHVRLLPTTRGLCCSG